MPSTDEQAVTFVETSRDGSLMVEIGLNCRVLAVQIEPAVHASWTVELLEERLHRLYTLAVMRARTAARVRANDLGADLSPTGVMPGQADIAEYRAKHCDF